MTTTHTPTCAACDLESPKRNHYFHGKLLDVYHFELESKYFIYKQRMLNRFLTGYGVVCGLDVTRDPHCDDAIVVCPGFAIDSAGREIVVPESTRPLKIPPTYCVPLDDAEEQTTVKSDVHVVLCYEECPAEPVPVHAGDCCKEEPCQPSVIRERFSIEFREGCTQAVGAELCIEDVISQCKLDYEALVKIVSRECHFCVDDCIPLANIRLSADCDGNACHIDEIDITVRPIVYNNDLLFQLLLSMLYEDGRGYRAK